MSLCERFPNNEALVFDDPLFGGATVRWTYGSRRSGRGAAVDFSPKPELSYGDMGGRVSELIGAADVGGL
jgi:hypothetical protein